MKGFSPNIPNAEFFAHAMMILTFIAINLKIPVHVLLLDPSKTNFSGWRGALDQARIGFRELQALLIEKFLRPVYLWKVGKWLEDSAEMRAWADQDGVDVFGHRWAPPSWAYIEPAKDAKADTTIIEGRLNSRRGVLNLRGVDLDDVDREIIADNKRLIISAIGAAAEINNTHADAAVDWRELAGFDAKGQVAPPSALAVIGRAEKGGKDKGGPSEGGDGEENKETTGDGADDGDEEDGKEESDAEGDEEKKE